jgi:nucleoside-diphosphate-sugar epimerase
MNNTVLIGANSFLGSRIAELYNPRICELRFENSEIDWINYGIENADADAVIFLSRACRKSKPRRDRSTMLNEISGISKILRAFPNTHFVFTSTKVVYGLTDDSVQPTSRDSIIEQFLKSLSGQFINTTVDFPETLFNEKSLNDLELEHQIYAHTKLCAEHLIKYCAKTYTIFRLWDIVT